MNMPMVEPNDQENIPNIKARITARIISINILPNNFHKFAPLY